MPFNKHFQICNIMLIVSSVVTRISEFTGNRKKKCSCVKKSKWIIQGSWWTVTCAGLMWAMNMEGALARPWMGGGGVGWGENVRWGICPRERGNIQCVCLQQLQDSGKCTRIRKWMKWSLKMGVVYWLEMSYERTINVWLSLFLVKKISFLWTFHPKL